MSTLDEAARAFFTGKGIAVAGVSRKPGAAPANAIYKRLRKGGYPVFPVNPNAETVEGDPCYPNLAALEGQVDAAIIATRPELAAELVEQCGTLGIKQAWVHGTFAAPAVSAGMEEAARKHGVTLIAGSCPMLFLEPVDPAHRCLRWFRRITKREAEVVFPKSTD
ncbi:MAG: CoA-binding protein [Candidatus Hydrogenedentota bacterium]